jgi:nickel-dependent lactate racemase
MSEQNIKLKYGSGEIELTFPSDKILSVLKSREMKKVSYPRAAVLDVLKTPIGTKPLFELAEGKKSAAIVVSDRTRTTKSDVMLPVIVGELNHAGLKDEDITIVFATGTHRGHTDDEKKKIVGPFILQKNIKMVDHDCRDESSLVELGTTSRGNKIKVNSNVVKADLKILTGAITYHYFAGFGGGRKSVLPGISSFETIQYNHKLLMGEAAGSGENPHCTTGNLEGNPLHLDMLETAKMIKPDFLVNTVVNGSRDLAGVFAGDLEKAHLAGCKFIDDYARVRIDKKADLVIASAGGGTKDMNFVQSHKAMENASYALKDGGTMILIADSSEGMPSGEYMKWVELGSSEKIEAGLRSGFTIPGHSIYSAVHKAERLKIIWVTKLDKGIVKKMGMTPVDSIEEALKLVKLEEAYIMPEAYLTLPVIG